MLQDQSRLHRTVDPAQLGYHVEKTLEEEKVGCLCMHWDSEAVKKVIGWRGVTLYFFRIIILYGHI